MKQEGRQIGACRMRGALHDAIGTTDALVLLQFKVKQELAEKESAVSDNSQKSPPDPSEREHGEGNYKAGRAYQKAASKKAGTPESRQAAEQAKRARESDATREELEAAERAGKEPARGVPEK